MNNGVAAKITIIKGSLRCFAYGLLAFLPGVWIPFAIAALWNAGHVRSLEKRYWNAAGPYRSWGIVCAAFSLIYWFIAVALITYNAAASDNGTGSFNSLYGYNDGGGE